MGQPSAPAGHARCTCGHFPTQHMTVVPDLPGKPGGYHLAPTGPCSKCGPTGCAKYVPAA